ncbi:hypothetical protein DFH29DRAFT_1002112 [Suillus ampliporus]|nr:hypothetical protein DFH29DRAFT_1002112 [Suillus ampliporus]
MSSHPAVRFNEPPVTDYNAMDLDESSVSQVSLDDLYLGPDDDIEYDSVSSGPLDVLAEIPALPIDPDLYLGPEDDHIDVDELPDSADAEPDAPAPPEVSMSSDETSTELHAEQPELTNEDLYSMVREFWPFGSFEHTGLKSIKDRLGDYTRRNGDLPDPSIPQLLEAERPFRTAWAETSDKLKRADADLQRLQRAERMSVEMLKVVDSLIDRLEEQIQM